MTESQTKAEEATNQATSISFVESSRFFNEKIREQTKVFDSIFNITKETIEETYKQINDIGCEIDLYIGCIMHALKIRPKQTECYFSLLEMIKKITSYFPKCNLPKEYQIILVKRGIIKENPKVIWISMDSDDDYEEEEYYDINDYEGDKKDYFQENIVKAIVEDDIDTFIKQSAAKNFDSKHKLKSRNIYLVYYVEMNEEVSYMQIMALFGSIKCFKYALIDGSYDEDNLIKYAVAGGNVEIIHLLEQKGERFDGCIEVSTKYNRYEISDWILRNYESDEFEIINNVDYFNNRALFFFLKTKNELTKESIKSLLFTSAGTGNISLIMYLIEEYKVDIGEKEYLQRTILHTASLIGNIELVKFLIEECHANVEEKDIYGETALAYSSWNDNFELVKYLVEVCHANTEEKDNKGRTILHFASASGYIELVKYLVEKCHANVEDKDKRGKTALLLACEKGKLELVKYLNEYCHANVEEKDNKGRTALYFASDKSNFELVKYLVEECHANVETISRNSFFKAINKLDANLTKYLVEECNISIENQDERIGTILHFCIKTYNNDIFMYLAQKCPSAIKEKDILGQTVLHIATKHNDTDLIKFIYDTYPAIINEKDGNGYTPLHWAAEKNHFDAVKVLVEECHANIYEYNNNGQTPLSLAAANSNMNIVKYFIFDCNQTVINDIPETILQLIDYKH